jgi:hypothetical protein
VTNFPLIDYGKLDGDAVELAEEAVSCLEDCFIGGMLEDHTTAVAYIASMMQSFERERRLRAVGSVQQKT